MVKGLVTIMTPCYNGEEYIDQYIKSVLNQTYPKIQLIFINDGSQDKTGEKILSYEKELEKRGIDFNYIYQENSGQAVAINRNLKKVKGEFLTWPDSDDIMNYDSIAKRVKYLEEHPEYGLVRNAVTMIDYDTNEEIGKFQLEKNKVKTNILEDLIMGTDVFYAPISYMVRTECLWKVNPKKQIYETRFGQNWQILLPITSQYKCGYIDEVLCKYYVRQDSHSRIKYKTIEEEYNKLQQHIKILQNVLKPINIYEKFENKILEKYARIELKIAYQYENKKYGSIAMKKLRKYGNLNWKDRIRYVCIKHKKLKKLIEMVKDFYEK